MDASNVTTPEGKSHHEAHEAKHACFNEMKKVNGYIKDVSFLVY